MGVDAPHMTVRTHVVSESSNVPHVLCVHVCPTWMLPCPMWLDRRVHLLTLVVLQVLRLESRVLELELQGARTATADADLEERQVPAQDLGCKARGQGHSDHHRVQVTVSAWKAWLSGS